ncbi:murein hydrolase activator EnvC family protein [Robertkochia sediminum]|uniref:murein hydrolase activator EnvC family protein n=1 Tax=Robertkochia sediminum TaxID=2785326 RepID=UPI00193304AA|nr:peptidoglycan DD-metalloendopeptidase family protein [Robertkochia sediminum]MBL7471792.1 peptidoglycan DD-metalloendopeptidase family protein [Robertkochia sediminum]
MNNLRSRLVFTLLLVMLALGGAYGQTAEQKKLEARKERLQQEIKQINSLLSQQRKERKSVLEELEDLNQKIRVRRELVKVTNQQANLLNRQINSNLNEITSLRSQLETLKQDYAAMIQKSYKSRSQQSRLMFLLSSESFQQAFKRVKYMQQYAAYRKEQGQEILKTTEKLKELNNDLIVQRKEKEQLLAENRLVQKDLEKELGAQRELVNSIKKKEGEYAARIRQKQKESDAIDREIDKLVREAIARSNRENRKKGEKASATSFALTAEAKLVGNDFRQNKGKLPWPVEKGVIKMRFGTQPHPVVRSVKIKSNGVRIATEKGSKARSVFNGKVLAVTGYKGGNKAVLIQHGNYISVYNNLGKVFVKEGDKVSTKEQIGEVFTNNVTNETLLKFMIYDNNKIDNPSNWIYRM